MKILTTICWFLEAFRCHVILVYFTQSENKHVTNDMVKTASQRLGLLSLRFASKLKCKFDLLEALPTFQSKPGAIWRRALRNIGVSDDNRNFHPIQQLSQRRAAETITLFHPMFYCKAPELHQYLLPYLTSLNPHLWQSIRHHELADKVPKPTLIIESLLSSSALPWNALSWTITVSQNSLSYKRR